LPRRESGIFTKREITTLPALQLGSLIPVCGVFHETFSQKKRSTPSSRKPSGLKSPGFNNET
jgi:hypothetical protein